MNCVWTRADPVAVRRGSVKKVLSIHILKHAMKRSPRIIKHQAKRVVDSLSFPGGGISLILSCLYVQLHDSFGPSYPSG